MKTSETFIYLFEFKAFRHEERETQFLTMLTFPSDPLLQTTGLASANSENRLVSSKPKSQLSQQTRGTFRRPLPSSKLESQLTRSEFKSQNPQLVASGHDVIHVPDPISYLGFLLWHLWLSHPPRTRVKTCTQCVHLTNPCTKPKGSQPN